MLSWIGFSVSILSLLYLSRRSLALGMAVAAVVLAAFTLPFPEMGHALLATFGDPSVLLLALVVGLIPMIGGSLEISGQMDRLVANMQIRVKPFLVLGPALLGMLPMPGGALLSAPLVERGAPTTSADVKAAANVWFRHALVLIYPLSDALIASAKIASLDVYRVIPYLLPAFFLTLLLGYFFLLRRTNGKVGSTEPFSLRGLLVPLSIILIAPLLDILLKSVVNLPYPEIGTTVGGGASLLAAAAIGRLRPAALKRIMLQMRPWKYSLIILAMFAFLNVFRGSGIPESVTALSLPPVILCVVVGLILALITGRIHTPNLIIIPIYVSTYGTISPAAFAVTYSAVFLGYLITPIHPCISVTLEYFSTSMPDFLRKMALPVVIGTLITLAIGFWVL